MSHPSNRVPPRPNKPDADDCCGSGCVPCVFDVYYDQLQNWQERYGDRSSESAAEFEAALPSEQK